MKGKSREEGDRTVLRHGEAFATLLHVGACLSQRLQSTALAYLRAANLFYQCPSHIQYHSTQQACLPADPENRSLTGHCAHLAQKDIVEISLGLWLLATSSTRPSFRDDIYVDSYRKQSPQECGELKA